MLPSSQTVTKHIIDLPDLNTWKIYIKKKIQFYVLSLNLIFLLKFFVFF